MKRDYDYYAKLFKCIEPLYRYSYVLQYSLKEETKEALDESITHFLKKLDEIRKTYNEI